VRVNDFAEAGLQLAVSRAETLGRRCEPSVGGCPNSRVLGFACAPAVFPKGVLARALVGRRMIGGADAAPALRAPGEDPRCAREHIFPAGAVGPRYGVGTNPLAAGDLESQRLSAEAEKMDRLDAARASI
jgi:hypothetical protein